jgi:uncharacterized membrane protein YidH (DUF202 family)
MGTPLPTDLSIQIAMGIGFVGMVVFLLLHIRKRLNPVLLEAISVMLVTSYIFVSLDIARVAFFIKSEDLKLPLQYKWAMFIGAIVMVWRLVVVEIRLFDPIFRNSSD